MMSFTNTTLKGVELWILNIENAEAKKLTSDNINANMGTPYTWFKDNNTLLVNFIPKDRKDLIDKAIQFQQARQ